MYTIYGKLLINDVQINKRNV